MLLRPCPWSLHPQAATSPGANALLLRTTSRKERQTVEGRDRPRPPRGRGFCFSSGAGVDRPALSLWTPLCPSCPVLPSFSGLVPCPPLAWCWSSHPPAWLLAPCLACPTTHLTLTLTLGLPVIRLPCPLQPGPSSRQGTLQVVPHPRALALTVFLKASSFVDYANLYPASSRKSSRTTCPLFPLLHPWKPMYCWAL